MKKIFIFFFLLLNLTLNSQQHYWIFFKDKKGVKFNPYEYFDPKAIQRRIKNNYSLYDSTDFPVRQDYIEKVKANVIELRTITRWFNGVSVIATKEQINKISLFPFIKEIKPIKTDLQISEYDYDTSELTFREKEILEWQLDILNYKTFADSSLDGSGVRIAVLDIGFKYFDINPFTKHLIDEGKIIATRDFIKNKDFVYFYDTHGTMVVSCIAGIYDSIRLGMANKSEFLLARTEKKGEPFSEEENWLAAAEWADKMGADIINSSLGYTKPRYFQKDMDGETSLVSKAANMAAKKGILVIVSAGNDGDNVWKFISTPADADSVLTVGGISYDDDLHIDFSSFGPNARCITKPNVVAPGEVISSAKKLEIIYGTSFSAPLVTGFAACVLQKYPYLSQWQLKQKIIKSASLYPYYDYAHGYGIPKANKIFQNDTSVGPVPFEVKKCAYSFEISFPNQDTTKWYYLFYHFRKPGGCIWQYGVEDVTGLNEEVIPIPEKLEKPYIFSVHCCGYTKEITIK